MGVVCVARLWVGRDVASVQAPLKACEVDGELADTLGDDRDGWRVRVNVLESREHPWLRDLLRVEVYDTAHLGIIDLYRPAMAVRREERVQTRLLREDTDRAHRTRQPVCAIRDVGMQRSAHA
jgi:hypothetical protein